MCFPWFSLKGRLWRRTLPNIASAGTSTVKHILTLIVSHFVAAGLAYPDGTQFHINGHEEPMYSSTVITPPHSELEWGDINVIHTTDIHGWLLGHQKTSEPEPNFSADYGDFASFVLHMKEIARQKNVDLLLVDSGDVHIGNGLSDSALPGKITGQDSNDVLKLLPYDILTIGNNELYNYSIALDVHDNFAPAWNGRFLTSNVDILVQDSSKRLVPKHVGNRYAKITTKLGRRVTSLGVLFGFRGNGNYTIVQQVEDMVKELWFAEAIRDEPNFLLLVGHMPVADGFPDNSWKVVRDAIRAVHPETPILIFGGHNHLRNCAKLDSRSMSLGSGKYMETVGWMSVKNLDSVPTFSRRYLDTNLVTYMYHTKKTTETFTTPLGTTVKGKVNAIVDKFKLSEVYGAAPDDYRLNREPVTSEKNLMNLYIRKAAPFALVNEQRKNNKRIILTNTGVLRFDVFKGPFTRNDEMSTAAYSDKFKFIKDIPLSAAKKLLAQLISDAPHRVQLAGNLNASDMYEGWENDAQFSALWEEAICTKLCATNPSLTPGHVTVDTCPGPGTGDDTEHCCYPYTKFPSFVSSDLPTGSPLIDVVFLTYIGPKVVTAINKVQTAKTYTIKDSDEYSPVQANQILGIYAKGNWKTN